MLFTRFVNAGNSHTSLKLFLKVAVRAIPFNFCFVKINSMVISGYFDVFLAIIDTFIASKMH